MQAEPMFEHGGLFALIRKYYGYLILLVGLAFTGIWWHEHQQSSQIEHRQEAAAIFAKHFDKDKHLVTDPQAIQVLYSDYTDTIYAALGKMYVAKGFAEHKQWAKAKVAWQWIVENSENEHMQALARLQIARIDVADHQPGQALMDLEEMTDPDFTINKAYVSGLARQAMNQDALAQSAFREAYSLLDSKHLLSPIMAKILWLHIQQTSQHH